MKYHGALAGLGLMPGVGGRCQGGVDEGRDQHDNGDQGQGHGELPHEQVRQEQHHVRLVLPGLAEVARQHDAARLAHPPEVKAAISTSDAGISVVWSV